MNSLFGVLHKRRYTSYYNLVKDLTNKTKSSELVFKFSDYKSLSPAEESIIALKRCLIRQVDKEDHHAAPYKVSNEVEQTYRETIHPIRYLVKFNELLLIKNKRT